MFYAIFRSHGKEQYSLNYPAIITFLSSSKKQSLKCREVIASYMYEFSANHPNL